MKIEVWSDVVCPFCYIGARRLDGALAGFAHRDAVEVTWRAFELDPSAPTDRSGTVAAHLAQSKGLSPQAVEAMMTRVAATAQGEGLEMRFDLAKLVNTRAAHELLHLSRASGLEGAMRERLFRAYFTEGAAIGDPKVLATLASEVGLDASVVTESLADGRYTAAVREDEGEAVALGITGVPFFVFDGRLAISGAQPAELFARTLDRAWRERSDPGVPSEATVPR